MREVTPEEAMSLLLPSEEPATTTDPNEAFFARLAKAGAPVREMKSADPNDPVVRSLGRAPNPARTPGAATQAAMSFSTKPEQQARIAQGMGADVAGLRVGDAGQMEGVTAEGVPFPLQPGFGIGALPSWAASGVGEIPAMAGGIAGGMAAGPGSLVVGPLMAGAGAAVGDAARQGFAAYLDPAGGFDYSPMQTAREAAMGAGGQLLGAAAGRMIAPVNPGLTPKEVRGLRSGPTMDRARAAYTAAQAEGVPLTPGQATGLPSLLAREDVAARAPWGMDTAADFYARQGEALDAAGRRVVAGVSPTAAANKTDAALAFADHAAEAANRVRRIGNEAARAEYDAASAAGMPGSWGTPLTHRNRAIPGGALKPGTSFQANQGVQFAPDTTPQGARIYDLFNVPEVVDAYNAARNMALRDGYAFPSIADLSKRDGATVPFEAWDHMKRIFQSKAKEAQRAGNNYLAEQYGDIASAIRNEVIEVSPAYGRALEIVQPYQAMADELKNSAIGRVGNTDVSDRARAILAPIFGGSNPDYIRAARKAFIDTNGEQAWNGAVGAFIKDELERASTSATGLNASMLRRNLIGKEDTRAALEAAMTPQQFKGFSRFMETVENVARTFPQNSLTQPRAAMTKQMEAEAATGPAVRAGQAITYLGPKSLRFFEQLGTSVADWGTERNLRASLDYLFTSDGLPMLEALAKARPGTQNALSLTGQIMARAVTPSGPATTPTSPAAPLRRSVEELLLQ